MLGVLTYLLIGIVIARLDIAAESFREKLTEVSVFNYGKVTKAYFIVCALLWPIRAAAILAGMLIGRKN
ncbi:hypothetical protein [Brevibacillus borstelensis]|uniref:hypothetical protein n=1 Tax=Brevibacillus borstelensis TaxID=45462 RepID=UPI00287F4BEF|nr:hypothetical protein [Brevibacillus borstelensis]WNF07441.1 hypothetical protein RFB14_08550 [Brevibacillus borstelensis]